MAREDAGSSPVGAVAGGAASAAERLPRTEIWHWSQHSREENAGPDECPWRRQQLALLPLQQQESESCEANASAGIG
jgi:hypothetical protein